MSFLKKLFGFKKINDFTIYVGENCHDCEEVITELKKMNKQFEIINIDESGKSTPIPIFAFPAMFKGEKLIAYGFDILKKA